MTVVADRSSAQEELALVQLSPEEVLPHIETCRTMTEALRLAWRLAGVRREKTIAHELGRDPGQMARVFGGDAHYPHEELLRTANLTGNDAPALWLLRNRGWDIRTLRPIETELQRTIRQQADRISELEQERLVLVRAIRGDTA